MVSSHIQSTAAAAQNAREMQVTAASRTRWLAVLQANHPDQCCSEAGRECPDQEDEADHSQFTEGLGVEGVRVLYVERQRSVLEPPRLVAARPSAFERLALELVDRGAPRAASVRSRAH